MNLHNPPHFTYLLLHILNYIDWKYELAVVHQCLFQSAAVPVSWGDLNINHHFSYFSSSDLSQTSPLPLYHLWTRRVAHLDITGQIIQIKSLFSKIICMFTLKITEIIWTAVTICPGRPGYATHMVHRGYAWSYCQPHFFSQCVLLSAVDSFWNTASVWIGKVIIGCGRIVKRVP